MDKLIPGVQPLRAARLFYFFYFGALASLVPFLTVYYELVGLSGRQIGILTGIPPLVALVAGPIWGGVADVTRRHRLMLAVAVAGVMGTVFAFSRIASFLGLLPVVFAYAFFTAPIVPLVDNTVMELLANRRGDYGRQRLWGTIGWGVVAPFVGEASDRLGFNWLFYACLALLFLALLVAQTMPVSQGGLKEPFWYSLRRLLANRALVLLLGTVLMGGMGLSLINNFLFLYMQRLGADNSLMGVALTVGTVSELPVMFYSGRLLQRWGAPRLLAIGLAAYVVRALALSWIQNPWLVLPTQLLHGPVFGLLWVAGVSYASEIAPAGMGATAQSVFGSVMFGLGGAGGGFFGGFLYDAVGPALMFRLAGLVVLVAWFLLLLAGRIEARRALTGPPG